MPINNLEKNEGNSGEKFESGFNNPAFLGSSPNGGEEKISQKEENQIPTSSMDLKGVVEIAGSRVKDPRGHVEEEVLGSMVVTEDILKIIEGENGGKSQVWLKNGKTVFMSNEQLAELGLK